MNRLLLAIRNRSPESNLWYSNGSWKSASQVYAIVKHTVKKITSHSNIALAFERNEELALGILSTNGCCNRVLLVPTSWNQETLDKYLLRANIDHVFSSRKDILGSPLFEDLDNASMLIPSLDQKMCSQNAKTGWIIPTSGTTGHPKLVEHTLSSLTKTVKEDSAIGAKYTWGMLYELGRFAGLQVFFQAMLGGSKLSFPTLGSPLSDTLNDLNNSHCNAISATPTMWKRLLMTAEVKKLSLDLITLGGEISDQHILKALTKTFEKARIIHIYASTEAGVGFTVNDGLAGFPASYLDDAPSQIELSVTKNGALWLKPAIASQKYIQEAKPLKSKGGWINSGDLVKLVDKRYYFLGRENGAINVGGNKVFPEEIESIIEKVKGVSLALVKGKPNPFTGSIVVAYVKPIKNQEENALRDEISYLCRSTLEPFKVPALIEFTDAIEINESGKIVRT